MQACTCVLLDNTNMNGPSRIVFPILSWDVVQVDIALYEYLSVLIDEPVFIFNCCCNDIG